MTEKNTKTWTDERVKLLLSVRKDLNKIFTGKRGNQHNGWEQVGEIMQLPANDCKKKWENMVQTYKKLKYPPTGRGTDEPKDETAISWKFYTSMDEILGERHNITPPYTVDTSSLAAALAHADLSSSLGDSSIETTLSDDAAEEVVLGTNWEAVKLPTATSTPARKPADNAQPGPSGINCRTGATRDDARDEPTPGTSGTKRNKPADAGGANKKRKKSVPEEMLQMMREESAAQRVYETEILELIRQILQRRE